MSEKRALAEFDSVKFFSESDFFFSESDFTESSFVFYCRIREKIIVLQENCQ